MATRENCLLTYGNTRKVQYATSLKKIHVANCWGQIWTQTVCPQSPAISDGAVCVDAIGPMRHNIMKCWWTPQVKERKGTSTFQKKGSGRQPGRSPNGTGATSPRLTPLRSETERSKPTRAERHGEDRPAEVTLDRNNSPEGPKANCKKTFLTGCSLSPHY